MVSSNQRWPLYDGCERQHVPKLQGVVEAYEWPDCED